MVSYYSKLILMLANINLILLYLIVKLLRLVEVTFKIEEVSGLVVTNLTNACKRITLYVFILY